MHLHLLGSSAGKPVPRPFCSCRVCLSAIENGGADVRTRTGLHIYPLDSWHRQGRVKKPRYQVDLSPDYVHQIIRERIDSSGLTHLFFTHLHDDHCAPETLAFRRTIRSSKGDLPLLNVYGNEAVAEKVARELRDPERDCCVFHVIRDGDTVKAGELTVTAFRSVHAGASGCLHYAVDDGRHRVLLAWDGTWEEDVWERLRASKPFDALLMECTHLGPAHGGLGDHLTYQDFVAIRERLVEQGTLGPDAPVVAVHIGDNGALTHAEAQELCARDGITVGCDGYVLALE